MRHVGTFRTLLSYQEYAYSDNQIERIAEDDNFVSSREYDRIITSRIQSNQYYNNKHISKHEGGVIRDYSEVKKTKTILVVDDDPDTTLAVKKSLEIENSRTSNSTYFQIYTYNLPVLALSEFKPKFYDLLLIDVEMPIMNGFELSTKILEIDPDPKICFMSAAEVNYEAMREIYPTVSFGCFIKKPVSLDHLIRSVNAELG